MITHDAPAIDDAALSRAALAVADTLGVEGSCDSTDAWPSDAGAGHLFATFRGNTTGALHLVVDETTAESLLGDPSTAPQLLGPALDALGVPTDDIDVDPFVVGDADPASSARISQADGTSVWFGLTFDVPASRTDEFRPTPMNVGETAPRGAATMGSLSMLSDVDMEVTVELGRTKMPIRELLALQPGMVVEIDRAAGAPIDVLVNGRLIACGEVVVIDEEFGVRITEIVASGGNG